MTSADLGAGLALSTVAGWNQRIADWTLMLAMSGPAARVAEREGSVIGTAFGIQYERWGWVAMVLVDPGCRRQGIGEALVNSVLDAVAAERPVGLDATPAGRGLYRKLGFEDAEDVLRMVRREPRAEEAQAPAHAGVRPLTDADLSRVLTLDHALVAGRAPAIRWAHASVPAAAWIAEDDAGITGYCLGRRGRLFTQIGPVVAVSDAVAESLVATALAAVQDGPFVLDVPSRFAGLLAWLDSRGFAAERTLHRMWKPAAGQTLPHTGAAGPLAQIAIFGPDLG